MIFLQNNELDKDTASPKNNANSFGSHALHKNVKIGNKTGVLVASSTMGLTIFDLFNEIINVDDMKLGCTLRYY